MAGLRPIVSDAQLEVLQLLVDRRRAIGEEHTRKVSQLHRILLEMQPGGAKKYRSAAQAKTILAGVRPRDAVGKTRRRVAVEPDPPNLSVERPCRPRLDTEGSQ